jgi:hypothetical protein
MPMRLDEGWNQIQFNLADFTRRAYGTNYVETLRIQIHANCRIRRIYFSDRLYGEEELPAEFKLFLPVQVRWGKGRSLSTGATEQQRARGRFPKSSPIHQPQSVPCAVQKSATTTTALSASGSSSSSSSAAPASIAAASAAAVAAAGGGGMMLGEEGVGEEEDIAAHGAMDGPEEAPSDDLLIAGGAFEGGVADDVAGEADGAGAVDMGVAGTEMPTSMPGT